LKYPITVKKIDFPKCPPIQEKLLFGAKSGDMVAIRPCNKIYAEKTFLGILLGEIPLSCICTFNQKNGTLSISRGMYNPAIFIPELNKTILGAESFWGKIENEKQLQNITNEDIENVWYIKALKQIKELES
jgi:hypothetical protein